METNPLPNTAPPPSNAPQQTNNLRANPLEIIHTRTTELIFPNFNPNRDLFYIWNNTVLRTCMDHHQLKQYIIIEDDGCLSLDPTEMHQQSIFLTAPQHSMPHDLWASHCPSGCELRNRGVDIWNEFNKELGLVAQTHAHREDILEEWEHFKANTNESLESFRRRFMLNHDRACANGLHQDLYREALKFCLLFACSRSDKTLKKKLIGKYEKMMNEDLTSWWVN